MCCTVQSGPPVLINPSHMGIYMELSYYPPTVLGGLACCLVSGSVRFSGSLYVPYRVTQSFGVLVSIRFAAVLLNSSVSSGVSEGALHRFSGKAMEKDSMTHKQMCSWKQNGFLLLLRASVEDGQDAHGLEPPSCRISILLTTQLAVSFQI